MTIKLHKSEVKKQTKLTITGSKSESNRLLLLQALYPELKINNLSNSDDSKVMSKALVSTADVLDIHHAGTAMRFLTAYFACQEGREVILTGSDRMKERPIEILVTALNNLGADVSYLEQHGCPPLKIKGKKLIHNKVTLQANVSSQYISALLLIASRLENGLELTLEGEITSVPYIKMTLSLLNQAGVSSTFEGQVIAVKPRSKNKPTETLTVESDWSSASYFFSVIALSPIDTQIALSFYKRNSLQGDAVLTEIYKEFGVSTSFNDNIMTLKKTHAITKQALNFELNGAPDIAQTIAVTCFGLGVECYLTGLHTLKIKETDRLVALKTELEKLGAQVDITDNSLKLHRSSKIKTEISISTYNDHRMAMAFAPLALKTTLNIDDHEVVSKSYPAFWNDLETIGFRILK